MAKRTTTGPTTIIPRDAVDQELVQAQLQDQLLQLLPGVLPKEEQPALHAEVQEPQSNRMSDETRDAILKQLEERAKDYVRNKIMHRATKCQEYFFAQPVGDFAVTGVGHSDYVDTSVADAVRWIECPLVEAFCGTQKIVDFMASNGHKMRSAEMLNAMVNKVWQENDGYEVMRTWINDALITPGGVIKIYWKPNTEQRVERYPALSDIEFGILAMAADAGECEIASHTVYQNRDSEQLAALQQVMGAADPSMPQISQTLHDVKVVYRPDSKKGKVCIENIPLEEFYVDPTARRIKDARYAAHARYMTISDVRGTFNVEDELLATIEDREDDPRLTEMYLARNRMDQANAFDFGYADQDPSMREVLVVEAYLLMDYDGDGVAEWRKIVKAGNTVLSNEPCDGNPFCVMSSVPIPHTLFGLSVAELAISIQKQNTNLMRSMIDNVSYGANAALWVKTDAVDVSHLLEIGPGSVIPVMEENAIGVVPNSSGDVAAVRQMLELLDTIKQERTGVQKLTRGSDADVVNETATGYLEMTDRSEQRTKLIARHFAETGVKPAALRIKALLAQYQDELMQVRVNGQTMEADPLDAHHNYDMDVQVGLGTGDKSRTLGALQQILNLQMQAMQMNTGMADLNLIYNTAERIVSALGVANVAQFVHKPPTPMPQTPPPQMSPDMQAALQIEQVKAQAAQQKQERQAQLDAMRIQAQAQNDNKQSEMAHARELTKLQLQQQTEREKMYLQAAIQREQVALQAMISPQDEAALFSETFDSTTQTLEDALTNINVQVSGEYDRFLQAVLDAPEPDAPDQTAIYPGEDPAAPQQ